MAILEVVTPPETATGRQQLADAAAQLESTPAGILLKFGLGGPELPMPANLTHALRELLAALAQGNEVWLVPRTENVTPQQAADLVGVSRQYLNRAMDAGLLAFHRVGSHRRIAIGDLLAYQQERAQRRDALRSLTRLSQDYGFYDE